MVRTRRILGIDPGSRIAGFGIIELNSSMIKPNCVMAGCIRLTAKDMPTRLAKLFAEIQEIVKLCQPTELAIEAVFVHKNVRAALTLGQARGVAMIAAIVCANLPVYEYAPLQIKQAIIGKGKAEKSQIQHMVQILLALKSKPQADAADALAVALCHLHTVSHLNDFPEVVQAKGRLGKRGARKRPKQWPQYNREEKI